MKKNEYISSPRILTDFLGPKTSELIQRKVRSFTKNRPGTIAYQKASGSLIEDIDGNVFLDFSSNINAVGKTHPRVVAAIHSQIDMLLEGSGLSLPFIECAEKLKEMLPGELREGKINYTTTGSEAIDLATRIARGYTGRKLIISFFRTHFGSGTSDIIRLSTDSRKGGLTPLISDTIFAPWPYCYRCSWGHSSEKCNLACLLYFEELFLNFSPENFAGIIYEGVPANAGVLVPPPGYVEGLRTLCEEYGIMFMVDEVFSGFGKTGKFLSIENWNVTPDLVCLGKSMGGGLPISAVAAKSEIIDHCDFLTHGTQGSFSGNIVSCAASIATMKVIQDEGLLGRARRLGDYMKKRLEEFYEMYHIIGDVRGLGLMIGLELVTDRDKKVPATEQTEQIQRQALKNGLLLSRVGRHKNVIRMTPHLVVTDEQVDLSLEILEESFRRISR